MEILDNKLLIALLAALAGAVASFFIQVYLKRRGRLGYTADHSRVAVSTDDAVFGSVRVTWQENEVSNLYASTISLTNRSLNDYENIKVRVFTDNTKLLNERTEIVDTTEILLWTDDYRQSISVPTGEQATQTQIDLYLRERVYQIPILNRGQVVRFSYLNSADNVNISPMIWLDIVHKGVVLKFEVAANQFWGVSQPTATWVGLIVCVSLLVVILLALGIPLTVPLLSFTLGVFLLVPGVAILKSFRWLRDYLAG